MDSGIGEVSSYARSRSIVEGLAAFAQVASDRENLSFCLFPFGELLNILRRAGLPRRTVRRCFLIESPVRGVHELSWDFSVKLANNGLDRRRGPTLRIGKLEKLRKIEF